MYIFEYTYTYMYVYTYMYTYKDDDVHGIYTHREDLFFFMKFVTCLIHMFDAAHECARHDAFTCVP